MEKLNRRTTLKLMGLGAAALAMGRGLAQQAPTADQLVKGKNAKLIVLSQRPVVLETPYDLLVSQPERTPKEILYIRNNVDLAGYNTVEGASLEGWSIEVGGLLDKPFTLEAKELLNLPQSEVTMVLQCSGNGRSLYQPRTSGNPWGRGGVGNVTFRGVKLKDLLAAKGAKPTEKALFITAHASRQGGAAEFVRSVPIQALENALLALSMNGEPLPAVHGGPVRLVFPGFFGVNNVKWVQKIEFAEAENTTAEQMPRYRVPAIPNTHLPFLPQEPGGRYTYTFATSRPNWLVNVNSFIFAPLEGQTVEGPYVRVEGVAFNDGIVPIVSVELSADGGRTWFKAELEKTERSFGWIRWRRTLYLRSGAHEIMARAWDAAGRSQPLDGNLAWNERGYEWNGVMRVRFTVA
ncbi:sulfite oxidase-like oxidoreductase [Thermus oshimai JL-2]|uniref:Sulfite oxidase-like oxidoreductase n=1 Tax=Thermus oshimai JL-2 TaxID=751945 RepID=K7QW05_THEOS|nr:sulfite oxidase [Thermus oshimai]AFV75583.1 sulfite oxidase-like oxidoreductase [Thermus oshimai JL-2]